MTGPPSTASGMLESALAKARTALQQHDRGAAESWSRQALQIDDTSSAAWLLLGIALRPHDPVRAEAALGRAIALNPDNADAHFHLGNLHREQSRFKPAVAAYEKALQAAPKHPSILNNLGLSLAAAGEDAAAEHAFRQVLDGIPKHAQALSNLVHLHCRQHRYAEALGTARAYLRDHAEAPVTFWIDLGIALHHAQDYPAAMASFRRALALDADDAVALTNLGSVMIDTGEFVLAEPVLARARSAAPADLNALSLLAHCRAHLTHWGGLPELHAAIVAGLARNPRAGINPFFGLAMPMSPALQQQNARHWAADVMLSAGEAPSPPMRIRDRGHKLRVGYVSSDFRMHAVSFLATEVWERHDRTHLTTYAYAIGPSDRSPLRERIQNAFDTFRECDAANEEAIARRIRDDGIDVLIDLNGYTTHARSEIFARRPAAIQAQWLGYLGTLGAPWMDYIITDRYATPPSTQARFDERFLYLPDCYCPSDTRRAVASSSASREASGLPPDGFVFCCFNNPYKLLPGLFDVWMRLLAATPKGILWLSPSSTVSMANLRQEAGARGVDASRLVFAPRVPLEEHLARHRHVDLYLDTMPYNAGTAANDALFMGVPVLTVSGDTMASRVAGSQLRAIGLADLIAEDLAGYEALGLALSRNPDASRDLKARLAANRRHEPLFDMPRFTVALEAALMAAAQGSVPVDA
ncbi:MAG: tetratricopeptide repeat protein [Betaproteobacteria bacterium]